MTKATDTDNATEDATGHANIAAALAAAQSEMSAPVKDTVNPHFKAKYADLGNVIDACVPALNRHGIAVIQPPFDDDAGRWVKTIFIHGASGDTLECRVPLIVAKNDMQGFGSAVTYARRYGLMSMAGIAPEDDDGNAAAKSPPRETERNAEADVKARQIAIDRLTRADSLAGLQTVWASLNGIRSDPLVQEAKDAMKAQIEAQQSDANDDLQGDEIPY